jgi:hypothetical protein
MTHPHALACGVPAWVEDHAVRFTMRGLPLVEPVFAALEPVVGARAWGVAVEWSDAQWARICRREWPYEIREVVACDRRGEEHACVAFFSGGRFRVRERTPSARYARLLLSGAEHHALPADVVARYRELVEKGARWSVRLRELL